LDGACGVCSSLGWVNVLGFGLMGNDDSRSGREDEAGGVYVPG
jgi:hypothetical protein